MKKKIIVEDISKDSETLSQMATVITSSAMSIGFQWAAQEKESAFKRE